MELPTLPSTPEELLDSHRVPPTPVTRWPFRSNEPIIGLLFRGLARAAAE